MEEMKLDLGLKEYPLGYGVLRFNPRDPNLYARFSAALTALEALGLPEGVPPVEWLQQTDRKLKELLNGVFGQENDFDALLGGVSLLAVTGNGKHVLENLLAFLEPILTEGAKQCVDALTRQELAVAQARREAL